MPKKDAATDDKKPKTKTPKGAVAPGSSVKKNGKTKTEGDSDKDLLVKAALIVLHNAEVKEAEASKKKTKKPKDPAKKKKVAAEAEPEAGEEDTA
jgi:hypothetical protein